MRISVSLAVLSATLMVGGAARAQQPINPYLSGEATEEAQPAPPTAVAQPIDPYSAYPAPPAYGYQSPQTGPAQVPSPPSYQQGYYLYPSGGGPPVYYAPPAGYRGACASCCCCASCGYAQQPRLVRPVRKWDGARRFSIGAHVGFLSLNQTVGNDQVTLGGAGFQLRLRSKGRFGFEVAQSFLHGSYWSGAWQRDSFPFSLGLMFYIFPNDDKHHFNIYAVAGVGLVPDSVTLYDENRIKVTQDFTEVMLHAGLGAELRFKWFGIEADGRVLGLWRDSSDRPATYYGDVKGAPVPKSSYGFQGNLYVSLWF
ncbi:MAG: hypothetical protein JWN44_4126 [Myxococcales bacterium]|nr:hypothetical protein [Myxococcales bacterium]